MKASIIILTYNQLEDGTKPCIESVYNNTPIGDFELIVVDNDSKDGTVDYLKSIENKYENIKIIFNNLNKGYAGGNNDGMRIAQGDFIILLNNDTIVTEGWLDKLLKPFYLDEKIGIVGPISNYAGTEQKIKLDNQNLNEVLKLGVEYSNRHEEVMFDSPKLSFFCVAISGAVFKEISFLDEAFGIGMFEDDDYSVRVRKAGYRVIVSEGCFIYHKGSLSFGKLGDDRYTEIFNKNRNIFYKKHGFEWTFSDVAIAYHEKIKKEIENVKDPKSIERALVRIEDFGILLNHLKNIEINSSKLREATGGTLSVGSNLKLKVIKLIRRYPKIKKIIFFIRDLLKFKSFSFSNKSNFLNKNFINPYNYFTYLKKIDVEVLDKDFCEDFDISFSLITTVRNEGDNIEKFLEMIDLQTLKPSEVIIVDGGSTDDTILKINNHIKKTRTKIKLIEAGNVNIAEGRNIALKNSNYEYIVVTDAGSEMDAKFCKNLMGCFYYDKEVDLVGGISKAKFLLPQEWLIPNWSSIDWNNFLPSSRSLALKKSLALKAGGYPEYLTKTGEDTLFDIYYRNISKKWAFNKKAFVYWRNPKTIEDSNKLAFSYGLGDGENGIGDFIYSKEVLEFSSNGQIPDIEPAKSFFLGYMKGKENRINVLKKMGFCENKRRKIIFNKLNMSDLKSQKKLRERISNSFVEKYNLLICYKEINPSVFFGKSNRVFIDSFINVDFEDINNSGNLIKEQK